ncbi:MAG: SusD/RagB family nutrient-binding outer membrane lipoprotein [Chloroflexia bacterium]|nr:SusD/RagB family nutrient-binding outer membrane lipoprotein [Chloroflexia bacterium]
MKFSKLIYLSFVAIIISLAGCSDYLDINEDPNNLKELQSYEPVIPVSQVNIGNALMGYEMGITGAFWAQYWTALHTHGQFKAVDDYDEDDFNNAYSNLVSSALTDLKAVIDNSEPGTGSYLIGEALSIFAWQIVTDTWGDVPYFEALRGDEQLYSPKFDAQRDIYVDLLARIDALLAMDFSDAEFESRLDFIYEGDIESWLEFARSLKLKLMIRVSETDLYNNAAALAFIQQGGFITSNAKLGELSDGSVIWDDKDGKRHPMVEIESSTSLKGTTIASRTIIDYLIVNNDPRIDMLFVAPAGGHQGGFQGDYDSTFDTDGDGVTDDKESYSYADFDVNADLVLMSTWEINFYIAEVYARANDPQAKTYYDAAVAASLDFWGASGSITGATEYAEWVDGTVEEEIKQIAMQKWVSYCKVQHMEAVYERNRTKYPSVNLIDIESDRLFANANFPTGDFTLSVEGRAKLNQNVPSTPIYPNAVITRNTTNPKQKGSLGEKVWWDKKSGR